MNKSAKSTLQIILVGFILAIFGLSTIWAALNGALSPSSVAINGVDGADGTAYLFNMSVNSSWAGMTAVANITNVTFVLGGGWILNTTVMGGTSLNGTLPFGLAEGDNFTVSSNSTLISWAPNSTDHALYNNSVNASFWFAAVPPSPGAFTFTVYVNVNETNGGRNSTTFTVTVNDTSRPSLVNTSYAGGNGSRFAGRNLSGGATTNNITFFVADNSNQTSCPISCMVYYNRSVFGFTVTPLTWVNPINYTMINGTNYTETNFITNASIPDGNITFFINCSDNLRNYNSSGQVNITVDSRAPNVTFAFYNATALANTLNSTMNFTNISAMNLTTLKILNITVNDSEWGPSYGGIKTVFFNITNASGYSMHGISNATAAANNYTAAVAATGNSVYYNFSYLNLSNYPDGVYTITVYANDSLGNLNNTVTRVFRIDNTGPAISFAKISSTDTTLGLSVTASDAVVGFNGTCLLDGGHSASITSNLTSVTISDTGMSCGTSYSYNVTCYDYLGHNNSGRIAWTANGCASSSTSTGGGGSSSSAPVAEVTSTEGYTQTMIVGDSVKVSVPLTGGAGGATTETHTVSVLKIVGDTVSIKVASDPQYFTLKAGEDKKINVDNDGYYDIYVKLNSVKNAAADLTIKTIKEAIPGTPEAAEEQAAADAAAAEQAAADAAAAAARASLIKKIIWAVVIIIVIGAVVWYLLSRKKK